MIKRLIVSRALRQGILGGSPFWRVVWIANFVYKKFGPDAEQEAPISFDEPLKEGEVWAVVHEPAKTKKAQGIGRKFLIGPKRTPSRANTMTGLALGVMGEKIMSVPSAERINEILGEDVFEPPKPTRAQKRAQKKTAKLAKKTAKANAKATKSQVAKDQKAAKREERSAHKLAAASAAAEKKLAKANAAAAKKERAASVKLAKREAKLEEREAKAASKAKAAKRTAKATKREAKIAKREAALAGTTSGRPKRKRRNKADISSEADNGSEVDMVEVVPVSVLKALDEADQT